MCVSSRILFVLGFHLSWDSMVAKYVSQVFPIRVFGCHVGARSILVASIYAGSVHNRPCTSWAYPLSAHGCRTVRPISWRFVNLDFYPLHLPLHPMGPSSFRGRTHGVAFQGLGDDSSKACGSTVSIQILWTVHIPNKLSGRHLWRMTRVALSLDIISDRSVASSSVHFLYKYHTLLFSFLYFSLKDNVRALPSSLLETTQFSCCIRHQCPSSVHSLTW